MFTMDHLITAHMKNAVNRPKKKKKISSTFCFLLKKKKAKNDAYKIRSTVHSHECVKMLLVR